MTFLTDIADKNKAGAESGSGIVSDQTLHTVRRRVAAGALVMIMVRMSFRLLGIVNTLIVARILLPSDFGLVGLVTAAYTVLDLLSQMGLQAAIIRMPHPTRADYDTAWTLGLARSFLIAILLVVSAPFLAVYIHEPRTVQLTYVLAAVCVVQGFENIKLVDLQRELRYQRVFLYQVAGKIAGVAVTIPLAFYLRNYWALLLGICATRLTMVVIGYMMLPYRPRFSLAAWHALFHFSKWIMVGNVLIVLDNNAMTFLIARIGGSAGIGTYQVATQIGALPASEIAAPIRDPIYAGSARLAADIAQLRRYFFENLELMFAVITPLSLLICVLAEPTTLIFLGPKWVSAIPLIRYCALFALFDAVGHYTNGFYVLLGRQKDYYLAYAAVLAIRIPAIIVGGLYAGPQGALIAITVTAFLTMLLWNGFLPRALDVRPRDFVRATWRTVVGSVAMVLVVAILLREYPQPHGIFGQLLRFTILCGVGATIQIGVQMAAWALVDYPDGAERHAFRAIAHVWSRMGYSSA